MKIGFVSCTKSKTEYACTAEELYSPSTLFTYASAYCRENYDKWFILSAKHGVLSPTDFLSPYEQTLNGAKKEIRQKWAKEVVTQIYEYTKLEDELFFHTPANYCEFIIPLLEQKGYLIRRPLKGLPIGKQLGWYKNWSESK